MGSVKLLALSGQFVNKPTEAVDMLIVGEVDKDKLSKYLSENTRTKRSVKFSIMSEEDYKWRMDCKDKFIRTITEDPSNQIPINKFT